MIRLHPEQLNGKLQFMRDYISAQNAADGSKMDANANVTQKNIATMEAEIMKDFFVQINRAQVSRKIAEIFDQSVADEYIRQIEAHEIMFTTKPASSLIVCRLRCIPSCSTA